MRVDATLFESTAASTEESVDYNASMLNDGDLTTRWRSAYADNQVVEVDLGALKTFTRIKLAWEEAYGKSYDI
ncbi:discoidin domain-containing protein [Pseudochryseolinea flava]|nr:discoidin domain-containing protein [Pseudochryseolinea flava]